MAENMENKKDDKSILRHFKIFLNYLKYVVLACLILFVGLLIIPAFGSSMLIGALKAVAPFTITVLSMAGPHSVYDWAIVLNALIVFVWPYIAFIVWAIVDSRKFKVLGINTHPYLWGVGMIFPLILVVFPVYIVRRNITWGKEINAKEIVGDISYVVSKKTSFRKKLKWLVVLCIFLAIEGYVFYTNEARTIEILNQEQVVRNHAAELLKLSKRERVNYKNLPPAPELVRPIDLKEAFGSLDAQKEFLADLEKTIAAINKDYKDVDNWIQLGLTRHVLGDNIGSSEAWEYAKLLDPENYQIRENLGDLYQSDLKNYVKAEENFKKVIILKPDYSRGYSNLVHLYANSMKEKAVQIPEVYKKGIIANPNDVDLMVGLADYYKDEGSIAEAKKVYQQALVVATRTKDSWLIKSLERKLLGLN
ncbi:MAG: hypothetical protein AAB770_00240 [Patescibacteria group bacterium]